MSLSALVLAVVLSPVTQHVEWSADDGPEAREHPAVLRDAARGRVVLLGGSGYAPQLAPLEDAWGFDLASRAWSPLAVHGDALPGGSRRVARTGPSEALLFGGYDGRMQPHAELVRVTLRDDGVHVARLEQTDPPPARFLHGFAWDAARGRGVLFGGVGAALHDDTWLLELEEDVAVWTRLETERAPSARYGFAYALDGSSGRFVVAGGADERFPSASPEDCWVLDLTADPPAWSPLEGVTLSARRNPCQAFAPATGTLVVHGGTADGRSVAPGVLALDLRAEAPDWRELALPDGVPPRASGTGFADADDARVWLGFGNSGAGAFRDVFLVDVGGEEAPGSAEEEQESAAAGNEPSSAAPRRGAPSAGDPDPAGG